MIHVRRGLCSSALLLVSSELRESRNLLAEGEGKGVEGGKWMREGRGEENHDDHFYLKGYILLCTY